MVKASKLTLEELNVDNQDDGSDNEDLELENTLDDDVLDVSVNDDDNIMPGMCSNIDRIKCFAHTLQLTVKDGIDSSKQVVSILAKVSRLVSHIRRSTSAEEKLEEKMLHVSF
uniref:HAT C-terminal dimerisation domain-containing protein n=1 Tax=Amphimedon queenslandica TaxID=400682 RepID=A0A1X7SLN9_AMPQE